MSRSLTLTDEERAVFAAAATLATKLRDEGRRIAGIEFQNTAADRALFEVEIQGAWLARGNVRLGER